MSQAKDIYDRCVRLFARVNPPHEHSSVARSRRTIMIGEAKVVAFGESSDDWTFVIYIEPNRFTLSRELTPSSYSPSGNHFCYGWTPQEPDELELAEMRLIL